MPYHGYYTRSHIIHILLCTICKANKHTLTYIDIDIDIEIPIRIINLIKTTINFDYLHSRIENRFCLHSYVEK